MGRAAMLPALSAGDDDALGELAVSHGRDNRLRVFGARGDDPFRADFNREARTRSQSFRQ